MLRSTSLVKRRRALYTRDSSTVICTHHRNPPVSLCPQKKALALMHVENLTTSLKSAESCAAFRSKGGSRAHVGGVDGALLDVAHDAREGVLNLGMAAHPHIAHYLASCTSHKATTSINHILRLGITLKKQLHSIISMHARQHCATLLALQQGATLSLYETHRSA